MPCGEYSSSNSASFEESDTAYRGETPLNQNPFQTAAATSVVDGIVVEFAVDNGFQHVSNPTMKINAASAVSILKIGATATRSTARGGELRVARAEEHFGAVDRLGDFLAARGAEVE